MRPQLLSICEPTHSKCLHTKSKNKIARLGALKNLYWIAGTATIVFSQLSGPSA